MPRPERLERSVDVLPGVGKTLERKLGKLGLETVGDFSTAPRSGTSARARSRACSATTRRSRSRSRSSASRSAGRAGGSRSWRRRSPTTPAPSRRSGSTSPGSPTSSAREPRPRVGRLDPAGAQLRVGLRGRAAHGAARGRLPRQRRHHAEEAPRARRRGARIGARRARPAARGLEGAARVAAQGRRPRRAAPSRLAGGGGAGAGAAGIRRTPRPPGRARAAACGARGRRCAGARPARRARRPPPGAAALPTHRRPGTRRPGDRRRSRAFRADGAAPPGRRRLGQDRRRALCAAARRRVGSSRRADGADETLAEQHFLTLEGYCSALGVSVGLLTSSVEARPAACGGGEHPRRYACADPGGSTCTTWPWPSWTSSTALASSSGARSSRAGRRTSCT